MIRELREEIERLRAGGATAGGAGGNNNVNSVELSNKIKE